MFISLVLCSLLFEARAGHCASCPDEETEMKKDMQKKQSSTTLAQFLADFIVGCRYEDIPVDAIQKVKHFVIDVLGCMVGASHEPQAEIIKAVLGEEGGNPQSSVFRGGFKTSVMNAALINGAQGHMFDFDDDHREGTLHPSVAVFPAVFALGEKLGVNGKELIRAFILGLEVMVRLGESFLGKSYYQGFHPTGTCGVFGAAAGCTLLMGLDPIQTKYALGLAGSFAAGSIECTGEGAWAKPLQAGHPAMGGVLAASLAAKNYRGPGTILDGVDGGLIRAFSFQDQYDYDRITDNIGEKWEMMDTSIKVHACCRFSAPAADCALDLYRQGVRANKIKDILAKAGDFTIKTLCHPPERKLRPQTHVDAQFSLPYAIAVAICRNRIGIDEFKTEVLDNPEVLSLIDKVRWEVDPEAEAMYPKAYPATVIATLNDGRVFESHVDYPKGDPENPTNLKEIIEKFHSLTEKYMEEEKRSRIIAEVERLEDMDNITGLADLLR
jgi:2-methylcitrate dehydratase PrpD